MFQQYRHAPVAAAVALALTTSLAIATDHDDDDDEEIPFDVADIYLELNDTDGDLGLQGFLDGEAWKRITIEAPNGRRLMRVYAASKLRRQGVNEIFFESAEPGFDELPPEVFFSRFPEGIYEAEAVTLDGEEMESEVEITHLLPAPAEGILLAGVSAAEDCDVEPLPTVSEPLGLSWDPVDTSHPELGRTNEPIELVRYQVTVEREEGDDPIVMTTELPPSITTLNIPSGLFSSGDVIKIGIQGKESSGNQTSTETCYEIE